MRRPPWLRAVMIALTLLVFGVAAYSALTVPEAMPGWAVFLAGMVHGAACWSVLHDWRRE